MLMSWRFARPLFAGSLPCRSAMREVTSGVFSALLQAARAPTAKRAGRVLRMAVTIPCMGGSLFATLAGGSDEAYAASLVELAFGETIPRPEASWLSGRPSPRQERDLPRRGASPFGS